MFSRVALRWRLPTDLTDTLRTSTSMPLSQSISKIASVMGSQMPM